MTYSLRLFWPRTWNVEATVETVECASDAQAVVAASKLFRRDPDLETIEIWQDGRMVVELGGRGPTLNRYRRAAI